MSEYRTHLRDAHPETKDLAVSMHDGFSNRKGHFDEALKCTPEIQGAIQEGIQRTLEKAGRRHEIPRIPRKGGFFKQIQNYPQ